MGYNHFSKIAIRNMNYMKDKQYVICSNTALDYWGLTLRYVSTLYVLTDKEELDDLHFLGLVVYQYSPNINYTDYLIPYEENPKILFPTRERAIIETIKLGINKTIDEGTFVEALYAYKDGLYYDYNLLIQVADFFKVDRTTVDYWLEECEEVGTWG